MEVHFRNLTNGIHCPHETPSYRWLRLQSTWCEQKRWGDILLTTSPDLYVALARGHDCIVHDVSERPRAPRSCWQGLPWVLFACQSLWYRDYDPVIMRGGHNATGYFIERLRSLDKRAKSYVRYFGKFASGARGSLRHCGYTTPAGEPTSD